MSESAGVSGGRKVDASAAAGLAIVAPRLFDGQAMRGPTAVLVRDGMIVGIAACSEVPSDYDRDDLADGTLLAPGFIDVQVNGGGGILLNDDPTANAMAAIAHAHRRYGTTGCLPTLITDRRETMLRAISAARSAVAMPGILGVHLEGPFLNAARRGVHRQDLIVAPRPSDSEILADLGRAGASLVTLAPERVPRGFVRALVERGLRVAAGHTDAALADMRAAADEGLTGVTHLFNAMSQMQPRAPGAVGAALGDQRLVAGLICDGHHVDPINIRIAHRAKGAERLMLVTDAMPSVGTTGDRFTLIGREVRLRDGRLTTADGILAGAHLDMAAAVRNAVNLVGIDLGDALIMASRTPAAFLGLGDRLGRIAPAYAADMVALTLDLTVAGTWIGGRFEKAA
jgi:N-acetylglucosamine-6-phosphate deacetylase